MMVSDAVNEEESLADFLKNVVKAAVCFWKKVAKNPVRTLGIAINIDTSMATMNPARVFFSTPELVKFVTTGEVIWVLHKCRD